MKITDFVNIYHSEEKDGNMSSKHAGEETGSKNRKSFLEKHLLDYNNFVYMSLSIEANFTVIESKEDFNESKMVNGVITKNKNLVLGLVTADCAPIVMYDKEQKVLALLHGGMFNVDGGILEKIISQMQSSFETNPKDILVYIGPSIRAESYKYNGNILSKLKTDSEIRKTLIKDKKDWYEYRIDVPQAIKSILIKEGIKEENILDSEIDTYQDERYASHVYSWDHNLPEFRFLTVAKIK